MRSSREEECSGPAPSRPCGRSRTIPLCFSHFAVGKIRASDSISSDLFQSYILSADEINVSMMTCIHRYKLSDVAGNCEARTTNLCTIKEIPELRIKRSAESAVALILPDSVPD